MATNVKAAVTQVTSRSRATSSFLQRHSTEEESGHWATCTVCQIVCLSAWGWRARGKGLTYKVSIEGHSALAPSQIPAMQEPQNALLLFPEADNALLLLPHSTEHNEF